MKRLPETKWKAAVKRWNKGIDAYFELIDMLEAYTDVDVFSFECDWSEFRPGYSFKDFISLIDSSKNYGEVNTDD